MRFGLLRLALAAPVLGCLAGQAAAASPAAITNRLVLDYEIQADGQYTAMLHIERRAGTDAAARTLTVFPWQYSPSHGQSDIVAAYTRKADGSKVPAGPAANRDPDSDRSQPRTLFTDRREHLVRFSGVVAGDSIVVDILDRIVRPVLPGVFSLAMAFDTAQAWDDVSVTVTAPGSLKLLADAVGPVATSVGDGAVVTYSWHYRNTEAVPDAPGLLAPIERMPRLLMTTATDWQQIGRTYAAIFAPRAAVTPLVRETADAATAGMTDRRALAQSLYDWVSGHIGYVAVPLGDSNLAPHGADAVLTNRIGDSQDHAVLLSALLSAKGIASEPVLIDLEPVYRLSIPVPFAQLNHVMLYLPEFSVYADTTIGTARFGELPFAEYGKPVVRAIATGEVLGSIPVLQPGAAGMTLTTKAHITAEDMIAGDTKTEGTGPFGLALRLAAHRAAATGLEAAGTSQLGLLNERGTARFDPMPQEAGGADDTVSGRFAVSAWPHISADDRLSVPDGLIVLPRPGDLLIGPLDMANLPASEPTPCFAGQQVEIVTLDVGPKYRATQLPADRTIADEAFTYGSHWSLDGQTVTVRREFESRVTQALCAGKLRTEAAEVLREIRQDYAERVGLTPQ
jgi:transglutaminase-like putative cysteine protease